MPKLKIRLAALALAAPAPARRPRPRPGRRPTSAAGSTTIRPTRPASRRHLHDRLLHPPHRPRRRSLLGRRPGRRRDHEIQDPRLGGRRTGPGDLPPRRHQCRTPNATTARSRRGGHRPDEDPARRNGAGNSDHESAPACRSKKASTWRSTRPNRSAPSTTAAASSATCTRRRSSRARRPRLDRIGQRAARRGDDRARRGRRRLRRRDPGPVPEPGLDAGGLRHDQAGRRRARGERRPDLLHALRGGDRHFHSNKVRRSQGRARSASSRPATTRKEDVLSPSGRSVPSSRRRRGGRQHRRCRTARS